MAMRLCDMCVVPEGRTAPQYEVEDLEYEPQYRRTPTTEEDLVTPWVGLGKRQTSFTPFVSVGAYKCSTPTHSPPSINTLSIIKQYFSPQTPSLYCTDQQCNAHICFTILLRNIAVLHVSKLQYILSLTRRCVYFHLDILLVISDLKGWHAMAWATRLGRK